MNDAPKLRRVLREPAARAFLGLGPTQFWDLVNKGILPQPFKPHENARINLWFEDELAEYQASRAEQRNIKSRPGPAAMKSSQ
jgi:predicted DNA-binding transcriptional regulator AlpA